MNNRLIKFRAWESETEIGKPGTMSYDQELCYSQIRSNDEIVVSQFTGLKDRNGKEIYEGDIIQESPDSPDKSVVIWSENGFWLAESLDSEFAMGQELYTYPKCQVIGNIFENPSLLSQKVLDELKFNA